MRSLLLPALASRYLFVFAAAVALFFSFLLSNDASAALHNNSRLNYGNVGAYCGGGYAKGMVWLSNDEGEYYSEIVSIATDQDSVRVSIRGAVNSCATHFDPGRHMYAIDVSATVLTGLEGRSFYRGYVSGSYNWTTVGSKLYGNLNVKNVARCTVGDMSGSASGTVTVFLTRRQQQTNAAGQVLYTSDDPGTEPVPVNVRRTCPTFDYNLTPTITSVRDNSVIELPKDDLRVTGSVNNDGPTRSRDNPEWRITQVRYAPNAAIPQKGGGTSDQAPCDYFTGDAACTTVGSGNQSPYYAARDTVSHAGNTNLGAQPIGTRYCFAMSVRQYSHASNDWRHSELSCYIVGKTPKVNVLGGDLLVGRATTGANAPSSARVITGVTENARGTFGSWGEYGVVASGPVTRMGSGSGYVGGNAAHVNLLTFVNNGNTGRCPGDNDGCYTYKNAVLPDIASRFRTSASNPVIGSGSLSSRNSGVYRATGNLTISGSTIPAGRSIIINAKDRDVTINGDIRYASGPFSAASQIPQVVIIANSITINESVTNVDAWLIAPGRVTGTSVADGVIRTCNRAPADIRQDVCDDRLTVNGPIIANRLIMLRTSGSGAGEAAGDPAEVFNFRPDAYIWALSQAETGGRVTTVSTKELPPRY